MPNFTPDGKRSQLIGLGVGLVLFLVLGTGAFHLIFANRMYPAIYIQGVSVGGLTKKETWALLQQKLPLLDERTIVLGVDDISITTTSSSLGVTYDFESAINEAYDLDRPNTLAGILTLQYQLWIHTFRPRIIESVGVRYNQRVAQALFDQLGTQLTDPAEVPYAELTTSRNANSLVIHPGKIGRGINEEATQQALLSALNQRAHTNWQALSDIEVTPTIASTGAELTTAQVNEAKERAMRLVGQRLILRANDVRIEIDDQTLISLLQLPEGINDAKLTALVESWKDIVDRPAENAKFTYDTKTLKVSSFKPDKPGLALDTQQTTEAIRQTITNLLNQEAPTQSVINEYHDTELTLSVTTSQPETTLANTNDIGINERIGIGESEYDHSIPNRIHNVAITTERINNILVPPGEEFSFNKTVGEVSSLTGYKSAYVIKNGRTELGDGGGVCQVSTTLFRAVLSAGLDVTKRIAHSYRVSYYELNAKPGIDATVYAGDIDFRFKNDTGHYILIHSQADSDNLYMKVEIYGTSDGRSTEIVDHEVWGYVGPPPTEYYPDPSLKPGQRRQIDWAVGGVKAKFTNVVKDKDGTIIRQDTYNSAYKPWSAKYLIGI